MNDQKCAFGFYINYDIVSASDWSTKFKKSRLRSDFYFPETGFCFYMNLVIVSPSDWSTKSKKSRLRSDLLFFLNLLHAIVHVMHSVCVYTYACFLDAFSHLYKRLCPSVGR